MRIFPSKLTAAPPLLPPGCRTRALAAPESVFTPKQLEGSESCCFHVNVLQNNSMISVSLCTVILALPVCLFPVALLEDEDEPVGISTISTNVSTATVLALAALAD